MIANLDKVSKKITFDCIDLIPIKPKSNDLVKKLDNFLEYYEKF